jgi:hypothetical protein
VSVGVRLPAKLSGVNLVAAAMDGLPVGVDHFDETPELVPDDDVDLRFSHGSPGGTLLRDN